MTLKPEISSSNQDSQVPIAVNKPTKDEHKRSNSSKMSNQFTSKGKISNHKSQPLINKSVVDIIRSHMHN